MSLNDRGHIINKVSLASPDILDKINVEVYLTSKALTTDDMYLSKKEYIDAELRDWIKKNIKKELDKLKEPDENEGRIFHIENYNLETKKTNYISEFQLNKDKDLIHKVEKLKSSTIVDNDFNGTEISDEDVNFQLIKISYEEDFFYLIYYRRVKIHSTEKKNMKKIAIRERNKLVIHQNEIIEFGGAIELILHGDNLYINNPRTLEFTFNYQDNILKRRDKVIDEISKMNFIKDDPNLSIFVENTKTYMLSRRLANIDDNILNSLEVNFEERCRELVKIKNEAPSDLEEKKIYEEQYVLLLPLYKHIDIENQVMRINPEESIESVINFFADKIVESFLTKKIREN